MRSFTIFIFLLMPFLSTAQLLEGTIIDNETKLSIPAVTVINQTRSIISYSDSNGYYKIPFTTGDSILFSHTAYKPVFQHMAFSLGNQYKTILMNPKVYGLKQATIIGRTKYQQDSIQKYETYEHTMNKTQATGKFTGLGCSGCISAIADKILGISKRAKRFKNNFNTDEQQEYIDTRYTPALVASLTGLKDDSLGFFMNKYPMEYQFARQASELELKAWIRDNYKQYLDNIKDSAAHHTFKKE